MRIYTILAVGVLILISCGKTESNSPRNLVPDLNENPTNAGRIFADDSASENSFFSLTANAEASKWCVPSPQLAPTTIANSAACAHIDNFILVYMKKKVTASQASRECQNLNAQTKLDWFVPSTADLDARGFRSASYLALTADSAVYYWTHSLPQTATFNISTLNASKRTIASKTDTRGYSSLQGITTATGIERTGLSTHFCMSAVRTSTLFPAQTDTAVKVQAKGRIEKMGSVYNLVSSPTTPTTHFYSEDGLSIIDSAEGQSTKILVAKGTYFNTDVYFFGPDFVKQVPEHLKATFPRRLATLIPASDGQKAQLEALVQSKSVAIVRGELKKSVRDLNLASIVSLETEKLPQITFFSFCSAETKHFRSAKQGCIFLPDPKKSEGYVVFGEEASRILRKQDLDQRPNAFVAGTINYLDVREAIENSDQFVPIDNTRAAVSHRVSINFVPAVANGCGGRPCPASGGIMASAVLASGKTVDQFMGGTSKTFSVPAKTVQTLKSLRNYPNYFPANTFSKGINFSFAQFNDEIASLDSVKPEVTAALTQPKFSSGKYVLTHFDLSPGRDVTISQSSGAFDPPLLVRIQPNVFLDRNSSLTDDWSLHGTEHEGRLTVSKPAHIKLPPSIENRNFSGRINESFGPYNVRLERGTCIAPTVKGRDETGTTRSPCYALGLLNRGSFSADTTPNLISVIVSDRINPSIFTETVECTFYTTNTDKRFSNFDINRNGKVDADDATIIGIELSNIQRKKAGVKLPDGTCPASKPYDVNGDGKLNPTDQFRVLNAIGK